jgi:thymidylate kinase
LDVKPEVLAERVLGNLHYLDYWESGMDIHRDGDMYASFISYQQQIREQFLAMAPTKGFHIIDGDRDAEQVARELQKTVESTIDLP